MSLPKKRKTDINVKVIDPNGGPKNWTGQFLEQNKQFLPREVDIDDLDKGFVGFIENDLEVVIEGQKVPSHFLTLQRWNEFAKTWKTSDKYKNIKIPFISIVRRPNPETGTNPADFKIPVRKNFPYMQIPVWDGNRKGADIYGIPNPVGIDMYYTVRFFTFKMRELNKLTKKVLQTFASAQAYVNIKGHYFPIMLEGIGDESQIDDLNGKRYYVQSYDMKMLGYLVDTEEFEVKPAINRLFVTTEVDVGRVKNVSRIIKDETSDDKSLKCIIQFLPSAPTSIKFKTEIKTTFSTIEKDNLISYTIYKNGVQVPILPFTVDPEDEIYISVVKSDPNKIAEITIRGVIIV
jgi:hypothetical protein